MKKILKTINSRTMFMVAILNYISWLVINISDVAIAWVATLHPIFNDILYPIFFFGMFACLLASLFMWVEESLNKSSTKFVV